MIIKCKSVAQKLAKQNYCDMSTWQKFRLMMHVKMCGLCRGFHKDVIKFQEIEHEFDECCEKFCDESLDSDCKDKIRQLMAEELAAAKTPEKQK